MKNKWEKLIEVVNRTKEKVVFFNGDESYVIMPLDQYESSFSQVGEKESQSEEDLVNKINRDIAEWKSQLAAEEEDKPVQSKISESSIETGDSTKDMQEQDEDDFHIEPVNI